MTTFRVAERTPDSTTFKNEYGQRVRILNKPTPRGHTVFGSGSLMGRQIDQVEAGFFKGQSEVRVID